MIVKNEQEFLEDCLISAKDFVDEIIVVDTGSTDDTILLSQRYGATVFTYPWHDSFCDARNYSIEKAGHEWVLLLDADERLVYEDGPKLLDFIRTTTLDGAHFKVYNFVGKNSFGQYSLHNALRLLRNNGVYQFKGDIHEQITRIDNQAFENRFAITDIRLHHLGYLDSVVSQKDKRGRNIPILLKELEKDPESPFTLFNLGNEYMAQGDYQKALELYHQALARYNSHEAYAPHLLFRSAMCYYNLKVHEKAIAILNEGLAVFPGCTDMEFLKGLVYMNCRCDTLALECFHKAIAMGEPHPTLRFSDGCGTTRPLLSMALIYEKQQDYAKAVSCYTQAINMDNTLYSALYGIARSLKKMMWAPEDIEKSLCAFFSDPAYTPNRIMLVDILLSQRLCTVCEKHLDFFKTVKGYQAEKAMLNGKYSFYMKQYEEARTFLLQALRSKQAPRIFANARRESALLLFASTLIMDPANIAKLRRTLKHIKKDMDRPGELILGQVLTILEGKEENLLEEEAPQELMACFSALLKLILDNGEFDLFEKLLYVYNYIDSPRVLLSLAEIYMESGFYQLAASTVLRSIKELDVIDAAGAALLTDALCASRGLLRGT